MNVGYTFILGSILFVYSKEATTAIQRHSISEEYSPKLDSLGKNIVTARAATAAAKTHLESEGSIKDSINALKDKLRNFVVSSIYDFNVLILSLKSVLIYIKNTVNDPDEVDLNKKVDTFEKSLVTEKEQYFEMVNTFKDDIIDKLNSCFLSIEIIGNSSCSVYAKYARNSIIDLRVKLASLLKELKEKSEYIVGKYIESRKIGTIKRENIMAGKYNMEYTRHFYSENQSMEYALFLAEINRISGK